LFSIASGFVLATLLPDSVSRPRSFFLPKLELFTPRELHILRHRVLLDDPLKGQRHIRLSRKAIFSALSNWRLWPHVMITLLNNAPLTAFGTYAPTIISTFGFAKLRSNALASVGPWALIPVSLAFSVISDVFHKRASTTIASLVLNLAYMITNQQLAWSKSRGKRYAGIVLTQSIAFTPHPLNVAWMAVNCRSSEERAVAMAMIIMAANAAGIYGAQIFRSDDAPKYHRGFIVNVALLAAALAFAIFQAVQYYLSPNYLPEKEDDEEHPVAYEVGSSKLVEEK